jgi:hypothetical protein
LYNNGYINEADYNLMVESFANGGGGTQTSFSAGLPASEMLKWLDMQPGLNDKFRNTQSNVLNAIAAYNPNTDPNMRLPEEPNTRTYDQQSMQALIQAMTSQGGV